jgi:hypothetical protein
MLFLIILLHHRTRTGQGRAKVLKGFLSRGSTLLSAAIQPKPGTGMNRAKLIGENPIALPDKKLK